MTASYVVVGAGPAGMRAAEQLVLAGVRPVVLDEAARFGGQIYRQPPTALQRPARDLYGLEARKATGLLSRFAEMLPHIDYRPDTLVWQHDPGSLQLIHQAQPGELGYDALILATGATDRVLPFPGWTLPGIATLGGAQVALKFQACTFGPRVVFAGSGPLLYLVAYQYLCQGVKVVAILDAADRSAAWQALPAMAARPAMLAKGAWYVARLRAAGVPIHHGARLVRAHGSDRVSALEWRNASSGGTIDCDAVGFGYGLRPETQLADLAGCQFAFDANTQTWLPEVDPAGRSSVRGVYLAGDGAGILGADAAEVRGARAALAALEDMGRPCSQPLARRLDDQLKVHQRFRDGMEALTATPANWAADTPDDTVVCRCEEITAGELRVCVQDSGAREVNRLKALSRIGMGRCQGRMCAPAATRLLAGATGCTLEEAGRLRGQAPIKPVPVAVLGRLARTPSAAPLDDPEAAGALDD